MSILALGVANTAFYFILLLSKPILKWNDKMLFWSYLMLQQIPDAIVNKQTIR